MPAELTSQTKNFAGSIAYQSGGVVSKTIINKPAGTLTLFAFDKDQSLSEHIAPFEAVVYLLEGRAEIKIEDRNNLLRAGDYLILPAGKTHAVKALEKFKMLLFMVKQGRPKKLT
ncbi:MAG: cupin domain-containing protein [bacterium]|nr:cupin domain-containing protein [bacterium]